MSYFIVIGTDNNVQSVVDEIRESHLQHDVITSGCIVSNGGDLYYHWDVYNSHGEKKDDGEKSSINLRDALNNQIAQFNALLPPNSAPHVFLLGRCFSEDDASRIKFIYESLCAIGGTTLNTISIDVILIGYDLANPEDVNQRPNWKHLRLLQGIENGDFHTDVLYVNNIDYNGAATNVDAKLLGRFLSHWAKITSAGNVNPKQAVQTNHYAIGLAERQYRFEDLVPFFKLAAEERVLDRALHDSPSSATQEMLERKYYKFIDLSKPWIDGLCSIRDAWKEYCTYQYDYRRGVKEQPYSLSVQQQKLALYLNSWLKLYCKFQQADIDELENKIESLTQEILEKEALLPSTYVDDPDTSEKVGTQETITLTSEIESKKKEKNELQRQVDIRKERIRQNTFADARDVKSDIATGLLTNAQQGCYESHLESEKLMLEYLQTDAAVDVINEMVSRAVNEYDNIPECPVETFDNVGRLEPLVIPLAPQTVPVNSISDDTQLGEQSGCMAWFVNIFRRKRRSPIEMYNEDSNVTATTPPVSKNVQQEVISAIQEYKRVKEVKEWWNRLITSIEEKEERQSLCLANMDGKVQDAGTNHPRRNGGFIPPFHRKSISLIDMEKVRSFRDSDAFFLDKIAELKEGYFDSTVQDKDRPTLQQLIQDHVIDEICSRWHTLHWDGTNPFCNESFSPEEIHAFIEDPENGLHKQSRPFVEYVKLDTQNITQNINYLFYFCHPEIEKQPTTFRETYEVGGGTLTPVFLSDFTNSLCEVQVLNIIDYVDSLADFKPRMETRLHDSTVRYTDSINEIVGIANTPTDKAKAIYDWLCKNISYDTTYQIHDADRCWQTRRGVCQAYCELFVHLANKVGVTAEIVSGKSKEMSGKISDKDHAWIFVYTHGYDGFFVDPTWGAGYVKNGVFTATPNDKWFDVDPDWLIFTHYANEEEWNEKASTKLSFEQFEKIPFNEPQKQVGGEKLFEELSRLS